MPNPNEMARLAYEEYYDLIKKNTLAKSDKEVVLRRIRELEAELGIESNNYNSGKF